MRYKEASFIARLSIIVGLVLVISALLSIRLAPSTYEQLEIVDLNSNLAIITLFQEMGTVSVNISLESRASFVIKQLTTFNADSLIKTLDSSAIRIANGRISSMGVIYSVYSLSSTPQLLSAFYGLPGETLIRGGTCLEFNTTSRTGLLILIVPDESIAKLNLAFERSEVETANYRVASILGTILLFLGVFVILKPRK